jgi:hypothetical protein
LKRFTKNWPPGKPTDDGQWAAASSPSSPVRDYLEDVHDGLQSIRKALADVDQPSRPIERR